jgi:glycosyltransferase involved in cell wall biosynthesis
MSITPRVSACFTSYNSKVTLKNCIESFVATNEYDTNYLEIVLVDNGSDDDTQAYIEDLEIDSIEIKKILNKKNDYPYCLRRAKNQARAVASGDYFIDTPTDHLYVVKDNWLKETIDYLESEENISCVCHYGYPLYRFNKANNYMLPSNINFDFYVSQKKGYADYHVMSRKIYREIGEYREDLAFNPNAESDYMERCFEKGYKRALRKFPVSIIENEGKFGGPYRLIEPIKKKVFEDLKVSFDKHININLKDENSFHPEGRPMSNEELIAFCLSRNNIKKV